MFENESTVNAEPVVNVEPQPTETPTEPTEPVETPNAEPSVEGVEGEVAPPTQSKEENAEFAKVRREAEVRAREKATQEANKRIASIYGDLGITSIEQLEEAVKAQAREQQAQELSEKGYSEEDINDIIEAREIKRQKAEQERLATQYKEFSETFPGVDIDNLPLDVLESVGKGADLVKAYAIYQAKNIDKLKVQAQQDTLRALKENAETATGSITGAIQESKMSIDQVNTLLSSMTSRERSNWIDKNYGNLEKWGYFKGY